MTWQLKECVHVCWGGEGGQVVFFLWEFSLSHSLSLQAEAEKLSDCTDMSYMFGSVQTFYKIEVFWIDNLQLGLYLLPMEYTLFDANFNIKLHMHIFFLKIYFVQISDGAIFMLFFISFCKFGTLDVPLAELTWSLYFAPAFKDFYHFIAAIKGS